MSSAIVPGICLATFGLLGRVAANSLRSRSGVLARASAALRGAYADTQYYRGGFEAKMTKREAALVLGMAPSRACNSTRVAEAHRRLIMLNHPDRGGSPYMAAKINQARQVLTKPSY